MRLVKLISPDVGATIKDAAGNEYRVDGRREVDVPETLVKDLLAEGFQRAATMEVTLMQGDKGDQGIEGKQGEIGPRGPVGPRGPIGPMPRHEWSGTELRFQLDTDRWGAWVDLQGPKGEPGKGGVQSGMFGGGPIDLTGLVVSGSGNSYFPAGW